MIAFRKLFRDFARAERGNIAILFGFVLAPIIIGAGVGLDMARAAQIRASVQEAADGALLRVARMRTQSPSMTDAQMTAFARRVVDAATAKFGDLTIASLAVAYDAASELFTIDIDGAVPTSLMRVAGVESMTVDIRSEVKLGKPPYLEVVLALDNTGSMNDHGKLAALKTAANDLVDTLFAHPDAQTKVGLVPFAQYVNVGLANKTASWMGPTTAAWAGCVGSRNFPANTEDSDYVANPVPGLDGVPCPQPILPMATDETAIHAAINGMVASGYTYIPAGLAWGWRALSNGAPFSEGVTKPVLEAKHGMKALVLLTDGENTKAPTYPAHDSNNKSLANDLTDRLCDAAKADGIVVYTIAFDVSDAVIRNLLRDCGSTPGHYFEPSTASELASAFEQIATSLRNLSLSK
ncbi:MAG: hypothetical protein AB7P23_10030 [Amphiplicatus sp.]